MIYKKEKILAYSGNAGRLKGKMNEAAQGKKLTIGFIGGSITQGTGATNHENCYAHMTYDWWRNNYRNTEITYINAGIGGTDSKFGVARAGKDLLGFLPDVVFVEFAVNDVDNPDCLETAEGLIRKILKAGNEPAVIILCNIIYDSGASREDEYTELAKNYSLPCISIRNTIYKSITDGELSTTEVTGDNIHPNDNGHRLIAEIIKCYLDDVAKENCIFEAKANSNYNLALTDNTYENATLYNNKNYKAICKGFLEDTSVQEDIRDCFKNGWISKNEGDSIEFELDTSGITIQYRRTVEGPAMKVAVLVDDMERLVLDGKFDEDWGDKLELKTVINFEKRGIHTIRLVTVEKGEVPFYLVSIISK